MAGKARKYANRTISKEFIDLGTGGRITHEGQLDIDPPVMVEFKAKARFQTVKHKFLDDGTIEESLILTIQSDTFEVIGTEVIPPKGVLPGQEALPEGVTELPVSEGDGEPPALTDAQAGELQRTAAREAEDAEANA